MLSTDTFHAAGAWWERWAAHGVLAAEMETAALYTLAARHGARALAILTASDNLVTNTHTSAEERQTGFGAMAELALQLVAE